MLAEIENAIIERIASAQGLGYRLGEVDSYAGQLDSLDVAIRVFPAVWVMVKGSGKPKPNGAEKWLIPLTVTVFCSAMNQRGEKWTRHGSAGSVGSFQILEDVQALLVGQDFGLEIQPLQPEAFRVLANGKWQNRAISILTHDFGTAYMLKKASQEHIDDLLRIGLDHYLQDPEDDGAADAQDLVELREP